jgi:hypothetical protein
MTTLTHPQSARNGRENPSPSSVLRAAWAFNRPLTALVFANLAFALLALAGLFVDSRLVLNAPVWAKTLKFSMSVLIYGATLLWMLRYLTGKPRFARFVGGSTSVILMLEMVLIITQAVRGQPMHYNETPGIDMILWRAMTIGIMTLFGLNLAGAIAMARQKMIDPVIGASVKLGFALAMLGFGLGMLMTYPNATQMAALESGQTLTLMGAHNVNALVDGQTRMLPILGWNMDGGDLRIPHFVGMHGAQLIPLAALLIKRTRGLAAQAQVRLVYIAAAAYLGLTALVTWQALRDQSIVAPDALTLGALAGLIVVTLLATRFTLRQR